MSSKSKKIDPYTVEFKVFIIRYYRALKMLVNKYEVNYQTLKVIQHRNFSAVVLIKKLKRLCFRKQVGYKTEGELMETIGVIFIILLNIRYVL